MGYPYRSYEIAQPVRPSPGAIERFCRRFRSPLTLALVGLSEGILHDLEKAAAINIVEEKASCSQLIKLLHSGRFSVNDERRLANAFWRRRDLEKESILGDILFNYDETDRNRRLRECVDFRESTSRQAWSAIASGVIVSQEAKGVLLTIAMECAGELVRAEEHKVFLSEELRGRIRR